MAKAGGTAAGNFLRWLVKIFKGLSVKTKQLAPEIVQIVTNIKNFIDSPGCDFLTAVIPGTLDDWVQDILKLWLPKLLDMLNKVQSIAEIVDPNERMKAIALSMQQGDSDMRDITFQPLAAKLVEKVTDNPYGQSVMIAEGVYQNPELLNA